jgi:hypothetical protein
MTTRQRSRTVAGSKRNSDPVLEVDGSRQSEGLRNAGLAIIAVGVVLAGLVYGRTFLLPLAISILVWKQILLRATPKCTCTMGLSPRTSPT